MSLLQASGSVDHGIAIFGGFLFTSVQDRVFKWPYTSSTNAITATTRTVVIYGMPLGGHPTRTLVFDADGNLYVSIGSGANVDADSRRSRVMRYSPAQLVGTGGGVNWTDGALFADGLRNEVALAFDDQGRLWGAENGVDNIARGDLTNIGSESLYLNNPGEEINLLGSQNASVFYGYPHCWSEVCNIVVVVGCGFVFVTTK